MELTRIITHRMHVDKSVKLIGEFLFGLETSFKTLEAVRLAGEVLVDDWACLKSMVRGLEHALLEWLVLLGNINCLSKEKLCFWLQLNNFWEFGIQVRTFEASCGPLTQYGMKHMCAFANICNVGVDINAMATATSQACRIINMDSGIQRVLWENSLVASQTNWYHRILLIHKETSVTNKP